MSIISDDGCHFVRACTVRSEDITGKSPERRHLLNRGMDSNRVMQSKAAEQTMWQAGGQLN